MKTANKSPFTLIELLMVISIIAILMGILLPTINKVKVRAKITRAKSEIQSLKTAILMYESTYGYLPFGSSADLCLTNTQYTLLIKYLQNDASVGNPRGIRMLEVDTKQGLGFYSDPWGLPSATPSGQRYSVVLDCNYDGTINLHATNGPYEPVYASVAIWSWGPESVKGLAGANDFGEGKKKNKDDICSWR